MQIETSIIGALKLIGLPPNITLVLSDRDGVTPKAPYLLIGVVSFHKIGIPRKSISHEDGNVVERVFQVKDFNISFTLHDKANSEYHDWFNWFDNGLTSDLIEWAFDQNGLGIVNSDGLMYQSQPMDGSNYKRAITNITFRAEVLEEYVVNGIRRVETEGLLTDAEYGSVVDKVLVDVQYE